MQDKKEFNQKEYIAQYKKEHYLTFKADLLKDEKKAFDKILKNENMTKTEFLRKSIIEFKKERKIEMNKFDVINFLKNRKVKEKEEFEEIFALGNYPQQDTNLEKDYKLEDGFFFTLVSKDDDYAYISVFDEEEDEIFDGYFTYNSYAKLLDIYEKTNK